MGIARAAAELLVCEAEARPFAGAALCLGRQDLSFTRADLEAFAGRRGFALRPSAASGDRSLFEALGFSEVAALDASDFEGAEIVHDLNQPVSDSLRARWDLVFNGGTLEHVFDVRAALRNVAELVRPGGRAIHIAPVSNQIDHGFYCFSPTLLLDWAEANRWTVRTAYVFQARDFEAPWTVYAYEAGAFDAIVSRFHDVRASGVTMAGLWFCLEKTEAATSDAVPQQGAYRRAWSASRDDSGSTAGATVAEPVGVARTVRDAKRRFDRAFPAFTPRAMPRKIGRFG